MSPIYFIGFRHSISLAVPLYILDFHDYICKKDFMQRKYYFILAGLLFIGAAISYKMYNKPHKDLGSEDADFKITAAQLAAEFEMDEAAADAKFLNKIIELSGTLAAINEVEGKTIWVVDTGNPMSSIQCEMDSRFIKDVSGKIKPGDEVIVQGMCSGKLMDIILSQAVSK